MRISQVIIKSGTTQIQSCQKPPGNILMDKLKQWFNCICIDYALWINRTIVKEWNIKNKKNCLGLEMNIPSDFTFFSLLAQYENSCIVDYRKYNKKIYKFQNQRNLLYLRRLVERVFSNCKEAVVGFSDPEWIDKQSYSYIEYFNVLP